MTTSLLRCKGITVAGKPCKNKPQDGTEFCHWHTLSEPEQSEILQFMKKRGPAVAAFVAGILADNIGADLYDALKELFIKPREDKLDLGVWSKLNGHQHDEAELTLKWLRQCNLLEKAAQLRIGMTEAEMTKIMGAQQEETLYYEKDPVSLQLSPYKRTSYKDILPRHGSHGYIPGAEEVTALITFNSSNKVVKIEMVSRRIDYFYSPNDG